MLLDVAHYPVSANLSFTMGTDKAGNFHLRQTAITSSGAPTSNAAYITQRAVDITNNKLYIAKSVGNGAADWQLIVPGSSGSGLTGQPMGLLLSITYP